MLGAGLETLVSGGGVPSHGVNHSFGSGDASFRSHQYGDTSRQTDRLAVVKAAGDASARSFEGLHTTGVHRAGLQIPTATAFNALLHLSVKGCAALVEPDPHLPEKPAHQRGSQWGAGSQHGGSHGGGSHASGLPLSARSSVLQQVRSCYGGRS
jgi:hypothetical protein